MRVFWMKLEVQIKEEDVEEAVARIAGRSSRIFPIAFVVECGI